MEAVKDIDASKRIFYRLGFELGISKERSRRQAVHIKEEFGVMPAFSIDFCRTDGVQSINVCFVLEKIRNYPRNSKYATTAVVKKQSNFDTDRKFIAI